MALSNDKTTYQIENYDESKGYKVALLIKDPGAFSDYQVYNFDKPKWLNSSLVEKDIYKTEAPVVNFNLKTGIFGYFQSMNQPHTFNIYNWEMVKVVIQEY